MDEIWKILKSVYGLVKSGRLWQLQIVDLLLNYGFHSIPGVPQIFIPRRNGRIQLLLAKDVDDILIASSRETTDAFFASLSAKFKVGSHVTSGKIKFDG